MKQEGSFQGILKEIKKGMEGDNLWIPVRYPSLRNHMGISKRLYHLIGGDPGTGKTAFVDQTYVMDAHYWANKYPDKVKLKTIYFSMERSQVYKKSKWVTHRLYTENSILRSVPDLLSWGTSNNPMSDKLLSVVEAHQEYFEKLFEEVQVIDGTNNPTGVYKMLYRIALQNGTIYGRDEKGKYYKTTEQSWSQKDSKNRKIYINRGECPVELKNPYDREYVPDDDKLIMQVILDHIGKVTPERGYTEKQTMDKASEYLAHMRDFFGMSIVVISQFNRNNANIQRRINTDLSPEQQDFKGTGNTYEDADIVLGLFNPYKHGLKKYKNYDITKTKQNGFSRFRSISLMKNSYGVDNLIAGFKFVGECGYFQQLGKPDEINYEEIFNV